MAGPSEKGRDGERTPMQWNDTPNAGFTKGIPWLPIPVSYKTHNVATEQKDPNSILVFYQDLLKLRHTNQALLDGDYVALNENDPNVLSYLRRYKDQAVLVVLNMSAESQKASFNLGGAGIIFGRGQDAAHHDAHNEGQYDVVGYDAGAIRSLYRRDIEICATCS